MGCGRSKTQNSTSPSNSTFPSNSTSPSKTSPINSVHNTPTWNWSSDTSIENYNEDKGNQAEYDI